MTTDESICEILLKATASSVEAAVILSLDMSHTVYIVCILYNVTENLPG